MRVIGVLDLLAGRAVHARAGQRDLYTPVAMAAGSAIEAGNAAALARAYVERLGVAELYAADLDRILGRGCQDTLISAIAATGAPLWVDAGITSTGEARHTSELGAARVVVGLETLRSFDVLQQICQAIGGDRIAFSLDLRDGEPVVARDGVPGGEPAHVVARCAARAGVGAVIVLDLARVGMGIGLDLAMIARVRDAAPDSMLIAGGGIRGLDDVAQLAEVGCEAVLVATALHNGRLSAADVAAAQQLVHGSSTR